MQYALPIALLWLIAAGWLVYKYRWFRIGILFAFVILLPIALIM